MEGEKERERERERGRGLDVEAGVVRAVAVGQLFLLLYYSQA